MQIDRLETHDRFVQLMKEQSEVLSQGAMDCLKKNPLSLAYQCRSPYVYLFGHPRTHDDGVTKRYLWQPRLTKPKAQTNSYLFRAISNTDLIEVCWLLPPREMWSQYEEGLITGSKDVLKYIHLFEFNREQLEKPHPDDVSEERFWNIIDEVRAAALSERKLKQEILEAADSLSHDMNHLSMSDE